MDKDEAKTKFKKADEHFRSGRFEEALSILDELDVVFPEDRRVLYPRARCLAELSRLDEALQLCDFMVGKWDYVRARRLRSRILEHDMADSSDGAVEDSGSDSEGAVQVTPVPPVLLDDDDDDFFEFPIDVEQEVEGRPLDSEPTPIPDSSDAERRYGARIEDVLRTSRPAVEKKSPGRYRTTPRIDRGGEGISW